MITVPRVVRALLGLVTLFIILSLVWNWWGEYRSDTPSTGPTDETTSTVEPVEDDSGDDAAPAEQPEEPAEQSASSGGTVVVLIQGLNFRRQPSRDGELIRTLSRGTRLEHLGTENGWHRVRDDAGAEGYVSASPQYTELQ